MNEQRSYNLKRPSHLIAGQILRDIEAIAGVKFGPQSSAPVQRLAEQYQELLFQQNQKRAEETPVRQKTSNSFFTFLYPGRQTGDPMPPKDALCIAIPDSGDFVSICGEKYGGEQPSAVFYSPQSLRDLAHVLEEAADLFEENQVKAAKK